MRAQKDPLFIFLSVLFGMVCFFSSLGGLLRSWPSFKRQSQTQSRYFASCMPWLSAKQSTCSSEHSKPDKSTGEAMKRQDSGAGNKEQGYGAAKMPGVMGGGESDGV